MKRLFRRIGAALTYRDFRVLWIGAFTSTIGTWMQKVAQNWLVLTIAGSSSAFFLGLDSFLGELPILLFTVIGGVVADRHDRRQMLLLSQYVQMATAFTLAALVYAGAIRIWQVLLLSTITGLAQAFGGPAHQSLMPSLVDKQHLPNAIAFNSIQFNLARVIGPLLAGGALATFGMVACFGLGNSLLTFLPLFAQTVLGGGVADYTRLMACAGIGAVTGALVVAWLGRFPHMGRTLLMLQVAFGVVMVLFAATRVFWLNGVLLFAAGACMVMVFAMLSSLVQLNAPNEMRGRVMSIYMVAFRGGSPLGSLVSGWIANRTSVTTVLTINGVLLALVAITVLTRARGVRSL
jgi:predicted MFS family arabinose efflux permease